MSLSTDLYDLIQPLVGVSLIFMDENKNRPIMPYAAIKMASLRYVNQDHYADPDSDGFQKVTGDREFTLSVQYFGVDAVERLTSVMDRLRMETVRDKFRARGLVAFDTGAVVDISALNDKTQIEKRASLDIFMRYKSSLLDEVGYIDTVNATGTIGEDSFVIVASV